MSLIFNIPLFPFAELLIDFHDKYQHRVIYLLLALQYEDPTMILERIKILDFRSEDFYPMTFLTSSILEQLWTSRVEKKRCTWPSVQAQVESQVLLLRKGRLAKVADKVHLMLDVTPPIAVDT